MGMATEWPLARTLEWSPEGSSRPNPSSNAEAPREAANRFQWTWEMARHRCISYCSEPVFVDAAHWPPSLQHWVDRRRRSYSPDRKDRQSDSIRSISAHFLSASREQAE